MADDRTRQAGQVRSLTRALSLMRHLAECPHGMTLTQLADVAGLPPSTTHRLLTTLEAERFVRPDGQSGMWRIGVAAFFVGSAFARSRDKLAITRPFLARLMELSGETANLFVESDGEVVCIGQIESRHAMRAITGVGGRVLLHASAAGKAILAHMDAGRRAKLLSAQPLRAITDQTITANEILTRSLEEVRNIGYAIDDQEHALGLRCVAAPIFDETGSPVAALSVSGPSARVTRDRLATLGRAVAHAAVEATRDYGGEPRIAAQ
ncbi:MAG: IclR family transcriptional regulator C-terminal domain-containing protein [Pseudomonadota bacterium]